VLLNSTDLEELMAVADRVIVLYRGDIVLTAPTSGLSVSAVAKAMTSGDRAADADKATA
jgi:ABC-type uncharacterized transport system ATPase subunit